MSGLGRLINNRRRQLMFESDEEEYENEDDEGEEEEEAPMEMAGTSAGQGRANRARLGTSLEQPRGSGGGIGMMGSWPEQRSAIYADMFEIIPLAGNCTAKAVELLAKCGQEEDFLRVGQVLERLAKVDREVDKDRRAVDETWRQHSADESHKAVLPDQYKKIRSQLDVGNPGRNQPLFDDIRNRVEEMRAKLVQEKQKEQEEEAARQQEQDESIVQEQRNNSGEDLEMQDYISDKDPLSKRRIQEPVKNPICGHVYDRNSVENFISFSRSRRQLYQCPVGMCKNKQLLKMEQLVPFPEFFQLVRRARSRSRSRSRGAAAAPPPRVRRSSGRSPHGPSTSTAH